MEAFAPPIRALTLDSEGVLPKPSWLVSRRCLGPKNMFLSEQALGKCSPYRSSGALGP